jgi:hypothetical protein
MGAAWSQCPAVSALVSAVVLLVTEARLFPLTPPQAPVAGTSRTAVVITVPRQTA